ncbi:hypothetical protein [Streptomyces acidicola]|uniref:Uncharacterized protein n=1 Tax=Streptomyces acidicola TaxID=2596892 RepID=A0A5N8WL59_9ACTN|nr:hypothetical protein [Streptomyces acidicola]MPY47115.1 hypothetical protein [Streptomyces acidicola]MPY47254.1 hypothetical protein [Streptomyces acidicola]
MSTTATPALTPGDIYVAAARADHLARCVSCREIADAVEAAAVENGESMQRRDRIQLGFRVARSGAVTA